MDTAGKQDKTQPGQTPGQTPPQTPLDEMPPPLSLRENKPHPILRGLLIFLAVGMLGFGVLLQNRMFKRRAEESNKKTPPPTALTPPPSDAFGWAKQYDPAESIVARIPPPAGLQRIASEPGSFAHWLRFLPLKPGQGQVLLHTTKPKHNQNAHFAVIDIDTGKKNLQQAAGAIVRLRAEYLVAAGRGDEWPLNFTAEAPSRAEFRKCLDAALARMSTRSLAAELVPVNSARDMRIGDVFIHPGTPGHAAIVVDLAEYPKTGQKGFILAQSFIPAQDMHILVNPANPQAGPWYPAPPEDNPNATLRTPEWTFSFGELMRFEEK